MLKKKLNKNKFYDLCLANLYYDEEKALYKLIDELTKINLVKLLDIEVDDIINKHYHKSELTGSFTLQIAISKIYATINSDNVLGYTYGELSTDMYMYFKQLKKVLDKDIYELYVDNDKLNINDNFDRTFFKVITYNINIFKDDINEK